MDFVVVILLGFVVTAVVVTTVVVKKRVVDFVFGFVVDFLVDFIVGLVDDLEVNEGEKELVSSVELPTEKVTSKTMSKFWRFKFRFSIFED